MQISKGRSSSFKFFRRLERDTLVHLSFPDKVRLMSHLRDLEGRTGFVSMGEYETRANAWLKAEGYINYDDETLQKLATEAIFG